MGAWGHPVRPTLLPPRSNPAQSSPALFTEVPCMPLHEEGCGHNPHPPARVPWHPRCWHTSLEARPLPPSLPFSPPSHPPLVLLSGCPAAAPLPSPPHTCTRNRLLRMLVSLVGSSAPMPTMPTMCLKDKEELQKEQVYYSREQVGQNSIDESDVHSDDQH